MEIRAESISDAHLKVCMAIINGEDTIEFISEDDEIVWESPEPVLIIIDNTFTEPMVSPICGFGELAMRQYADDLLNGTDKNFVYTYHDRLFNYQPDTRHYPTNQIENMIRKLKKCPTSRRAQAITWYPDEDDNSDNPPCLQRIECLIRNGKVNMDVNFRSNDVLSAINQNMFAFAYLHKYIADELGLPMGIYTHYITSAHMYPIRDAEEVLRCKQCNMKLNSYDKQWT